MKVNGRDHRRMGVHRALLAVLAIGVADCTAHMIPSPALAELPSASFSALALDPGEAQLPEQRTDV